MTETVSHIAVRKLNGEDKSDFFRVLAEVKVWVDDRRCLAINAAATNFEDVQTNDLVEFINENEFRLIGRADNIINSGGVKIQLEKIEKTFDSFMQTYGIKRFFAAGIEDKKLGQKLILVLETDTLTEEIIQKIKHSDFHQLSKYEIPKEVFSISPFYETPTGKIDKKATIKKLNL
jgi:O-succinylbenzoic acid--CoA ligase